MRGALYLTAPASAGPARSGWLRCAAATLAGLVSAWCLAAPVLGQPQPPGLVVGTTTRLVQVSVAVRDRRGTPVQGLFKGDFVLTENGVPQRISVFTAESEQKATLKLPDLPPGAVSNRTGIAGGATVLLLDGLNTPDIYRERATPRVAGFLRAAAPLERIAVYVLRSDLTTVVDFTTDTATLLAVLNSFRGERPDPRKDALEGEIRARNRDDPLSGNPRAGGNPARAWAVLRGRGDAQDLAAAIVLGAIARENQPLTIDRIHMTCSALRAIARRVRGMPGRKNLVWVTTGFPLMMGRQTFTAEFDRAIRELNDAAVSVYPVDARGLLALTTATLSTASSAMMRELADRTGGRAFHGSELDEAGREVAEDMQASYLLAYYPSDREFDGKFRRIEVRVNRPGLSVRHRTGYYATPETEAGPEQVKAAVVDAVWSPLDATGLGLDGWIEQSAEAEPAQVAVRLHGRTLPLEPEGDRYRCRLQLVFVQTNAAGKQIEGVQDNAAFELTKESVHRALERGFEYRKPLKIHPDAAAIRIVVRSLSTGTLGSVRIPVTPSPPASPAPPSPAGGARLHEVQKAQPLP